MNKPAWFKRETFLSMAEKAGLNSEDPHLEELYVYVRDVLSSLRSLEELDLQEVEPMSFPGVQEDRG